MIHLVASRNDRAAVLSRIEGRSPMSLDDGRFPRTSYRDCRPPGLRCPCRCPCPLPCQPIRQSRRNFLFTRSRATDDRDCRSYRSREGYPSHRCCCSFSSSPAAVTDDEEQTRSITGVLSLSPNTHYIQRPSGYHHHHYRRRRRRRLPRPPRRRRPVVAAPSSSLSTSSSLQLGARRMEREERRDDCESSRQWHHESSYDGNVRRKMVAVVFCSDVRLALSRAIRSLLFRQSESRFVLTPSAMCHAPF